MLLERRARAIREEVLASLGMGAGARGGGGDGGSNSSLGDFGAFGSSAATDHEGLASRAGRDWLQITLVKDGRPSPAAELAAHRKTFPAAVAAAEALLAMRSSPPERGGPGPLDPIFGNGKRFIGPWNCGAMAPCRPLGHLGPLESLAQ